MLEDKTKQSWYQLKLEHVSVNKSKILKSHYTCMHGWKENNTYVSIIVIGTQSNQQLNVY